MLLIVLAVGAAMAVVMTIGWWLQRRLRNAGWSDVIWTFATGACLTAAALAPFTSRGPTWRQWLVAAVVAVWAARLGAYLARRVAGGAAEDVRYQGFRRDWGPQFERRMFQLMIVQAPASALLAVAVVLAARNSAPGWRFADGLGIAVLVGAIAGEACADAQMKRFKADPANHGRVCDTGLWGWSRHPNYLFEALVWFAYPVIALDASDPWSLLAIAAPLFMLAVLRWGTGVPPLEAAMLRSKGQPYRDYQARVGALWPRPPRRVQPSPSSQET